MSSINVSEVIDRARLGAPQILVIALCAMCMVIDGFDVQAMGYVAPALIKDWHAAKAELGPVFGAGLVGMAIGALAMGIVADKLGRRSVLVAASLILAASMAACSRADSLQQLLVLRFFTGLSMGAIVPNAVALAGEFSPARIRVSLMMVASSGFILGGVLGGTIAAALIPAYGWRSVFIAGAVAPLALAIVMMVAMPESLQFLTMRGWRLDQVRRWLARIDPTLSLGSDANLVVSDAPKKGVPFLLLFREPLGYGTALLWIINFMNLLAAYFLANWLPVIMSESGHSTAQAVLAGTTLWTGGLLGNLLLGWLVDRRGFGPVLVGMFLAAAVGIAMTGQLASSLLPALVAIAAAGFCVLGGQSALNTLAAVYYPTSVRSTGMGWALGFGRLGSIFGPVVGGELIRLNWATSELFLAACVPVLLAMVASVAFWRSGRLPRAIGSATAPVMTGAAVPTRELRT